MSVLVNQYWEMNFCSGVEVRGIIPANQLVTGSLRHFRFDICVVNLLVIIQTEGQSLIVGKFYFIIVSIIRCWHQYNTHAIGVPFGVDDDVVIGHGNIEIERNLTVCVGIPSREVIAFHTIGRLIIRRAAFFILSQRRFIINSIYYFFCSLRNVRSLGNEMNAMLITSVTKVKISIIINTSSWCN